MMGGARGSCWKRLVDGPLALQHCPGFRSALKGIERRIAISPNWRFPLRESTTDWTNRVDDGVSPLVEKGGLDVSHLVR
jgi:hypothetical protein